MSPRLVALDVGGPTAPWSDLGFAVEDERADAGGVALRFHPGEPAGLPGWAFEGVAPGADLDGLACGERPPPRPAAVHPNGAEAVDHVVVMSPHLQDTLDAFTAIGLEVRRVRDAGGGVRQAFLVAGTALLEVVGDVEPPTRLWGVTFVVPDVDALAAARPSALGRPRAAVQPGRRIVTAAGLDVPVAFMTPRRRG